MAETIGRAYIKILADGSGLPESIEREMHKGDKAAKKSGEDHSEQWGDGFEHGIMRQRQKMMASIDESLKGVKERGTVLGSGFGENFGKGIEHRIKQQFPQLEKSAGNLGERMAKSFLSDFAATGDDRFDFGVRLRTALGDMNREMDRSDTRTGRFTKRMDDLGDSVGRAFGKGSRNNFLNFFGSLIGNIAGLGGTLARIAQKVQDFGGKLGDAFTEAGGGFQGLLASAGKFGTELGPAIAGLVAFAAVIAGPVVSSLWLLLGAVTALISTLAFGLIGALAPIVGLLGPIALAGGAVAAAFIGMDDKTKKLMKESVKPLIDDLKALGDAARPGILDGIQVAVKNLKQPMKDLEPVFRAAGDGVATFIGAFTEAGTGPGFDKFVTVMGNRLPHILGRVGDAGGHLFDGLLGVFAVLNRKGGPVDQFLDRLDGLSKAIDKWSTDKGPNGAKKFFDDAAESADILGDVLSPLWDIITDLMSAGKPHGDSLMKSLGDQLETLSTWLKEHPDEVEQWMQDSEDFARALGDVAVAVVQVADALDTPGGRNIVIFMTKLTALSLGPITGSLQTLAWAMGLLGEVPYNKIGSGLAGVGDTIKNKLKGVKINWGSLFGGGPGVLTNLVQTIVVRAFSGVAGWARKAIGKVDISKIIEGAGKIAGIVGRAFAGMWKTALNAIGHVDISKIIEGAGKVAGAIAGPFRGLWQQALNAIGKVDVSKIIEGAGNVASAVVDPFRGLASTILAAIGHIDLSSLMHGSLSLPGGHKISWAGGGVVLNPTYGLAGEAGPEAIVPLSRPLHMVDPAVRELSAIAQGLRSPSTVGSAKPTIDASGWQIVTPTKDPAAVAQEVVNRLVAVGY